MKAFFLLLTIYLFIYTDTKAQAGTLDQSFGGSGYVTTYIGEPNYLKTQSLLLQPDGKIITFGFNSTMGNFFSQLFQIFTLTRYNVNGSLDQTFGTNGIVQYFNNDTIFSSAALLSDGRIILAGTTNDTVPQSILSVFKSNGFLDTTWGDKGKMNSSYDRGENVSRRVNLLNNGKILLSGACTDGLFLAQYQTNGTLDSSFGINGMIVPNLFRLSNISGVKVQPDNKILIVYSDYEVVLRYNDNGTSDTTFSINYSSANGNHAITNPISMAIGTDGSIILGIDSTNNLQDSSLGGVLAVLKFRPSGIADSSFNSTGAISAEFLMKEIIKDLAIQPDGKIIALIAANLTQFGNFSNYSTNTAVVRFTTNGQFDSTFANNGIFWLDTGLVPHQNTSNLIIQPDGKIVVLGSSVNGTGYFWVMRLLNDLSLGVVNFTSEAGALQVYPNPIHQQATLSYQLAGEEMISIALYDMEGKKVEGIINNELQPKGKYAEPINFNENVTAGNYILRLSNSTGGSSVKIAVK